MLSKWLFLVMANKYFNENLMYSCQTVPTSCMKKKTEIV